MIKCIFNNIHVIGSKSLFFMGHIFNSTFDVIHYRDCKADNQSSKFLPYYADEY